MPRDINQPPPLNPRESDLRRPLMEHFDNTGKDDKGNTTTKATNQDGRVIGGATTASDNGGSPDTSKPTVTLTGDLSGSQQVFPGTVLGEALIKSTPDLTKYDFTGFDGKAVDVNKKVEGDMTVTAKSKETKPANGQQATPQVAPQQGA